MTSHQKKAKQTGDRENDASLNGTAVVESTDDQVVVGEPSHTSMTSSQGSTEVSPSLKAVAFGRNYFHALGGSIPTLSKDHGSGDTPQTSQRTTPSTQLSDTDTTLRYEWDVPFWMKENEIKQPRNKLISLRNGRNSINNPSNKKPGEGDGDGVLQAVATAQSTVFLTMVGKVYQTGTLHGQVSFYPTAISMPLPIPCVELAAGRHFCLARMQGGIAVCSWGAGHFGQLVSHLVICF